MAALAFESCLPCLLQSDVRPDRGGMQPRSNGIRRMCTHVLRMDAAADFRICSYDGGHISIRSDCRNMNFPGNFFHIGNLDIAELKDLVLDLTEEQWDSFSIRQRRYEVHQHTQTIGLVYDLDFRHSHPTRLPTFKIFEAALSPALYMAADHFEETETAKRLIKENGLGYFIRASLVRLKAGCSIAEHQDLNFSLTHSHRIHLPVITNDEVWFTVGSETINMREGQLFEINNRRKHSVHNKGSEDRDHLILDFVLPGEQCCCGAKHHPQTRCSPQACLETVRLQVPCTCYPEV